MAKEVKVLELALFILILKLEVETSTVVPKA